MTVIKAGYRVTVTSWENDLDNGGHETLDGLTETEVKFIVEVCKLLYSKNDHKHRGCYGNLYDPSEAEKQKFHAVIIPLIEKYRDEIKFANLEMDSLEGAEPDEIMDAHTELLYEVLGQLGLCGEYYTRVFDSIKIEYLPADVTLDDVTHKFF